MNTLSSKNRQEVINNLKQGGAIKTSNFDMPSLKLNLKIPFNPSNKSQIINQQRSPIATLTSRNNDTMASTQKSFHGRYGSQLNLSTKKSNIQTSPTKKVDSDFQNIPRTTQSKVRSRGQRLSYDTSNQNSSSHSNFQSGQQKQNSTSYTVGNWIQNLHVSFNSNQNLNGQQNGEIRGSSKQTNQRNQLNQDSTQLLQKQNSGYTSNKSIDFQNQIGNTVTLSDHDVYAYTNDISEEEYKKIREKYMNVVEKREKIVQQINNNVTLNEISNLVNQLFSIFQQVIGEIEQKWVLFPKIENTLFVKMIESESFIHKILNKSIELIQRENKISQQFNNRAQDFLMETSSLKTQVSDLMGYINNPKFNEDFEKAAIRDLRQNKQENTQLNYQNFQLQTSVKKLADKVDLIEKDSNIINLKKENQELKQQIEEQKQNYLELIEKKDSTIRGNNQQIQSLKALQKKLENDMKQLKQYFENQFKKDDDLRKENEKLQEQANIYRERLSMQSEEMLSKLMKIEDLKQSIFSNSRKLKKMKDKVDKLTQQKTVFADPPERHEFDEEKDFFNNIKINHGKNTYFMKQSKAEMKGFDQQQIEMNTATYDKDNNNGGFLNSTFELENYRYNLPTYFCFLEHNYSSLKKEIRDSEKIPFTFIAAVRGIMDSKYNEFLLNPLNTGSNLSSFPDFVYSWLSSFEVRQETRKIVKLSKNDQQGDTPEIKLAHFYLVLQNPLLSKLWEVITFYCFHCY